MDIWPNWVDLVVVTIVLLTCYRGYWRGLLAEVFNLAGAVVITSVTLNYGRVIGQWVPLSAWIGEPIGSLTLFWGLFLLLWYAVRLIRKRLSAMMKWERLHWIIQSAGLVCGGIRGLWWAGFILIALSSSGFVYLQESVDKRSLLAPKLIPLSREALRETADYVPGAHSRGATLIPPVRRPAE